jgi:hypothetical protein
MRGLTPRFRGGSRRSRCGPVRAHVMRPRRVHLLPASNEICDAAARAIRPLAKLGIPWVARERTRLLSFEPDLSTFGYTPHHD